MRNVGIQKKCLFATMAKCEHLYILFYYVLVISWLFFVRQKHNSNIEPYSSGETCSMCPDNCNKGLCDCDGVFCSNGGIIDLKTCKCKCSHPTFGGDSCDKGLHKTCVCLSLIKIFIYRCFLVNCPTEDSALCNEMFIEDKCSSYPLVRANCPYTCGLCSKN
jgi:hypothetical protein